MVYFLYEDAVVFLHVVSAFILSCVFGRMKCFAFRLNGH